MHPMKSQTPPKKASPTDWHPADVVAAVRKKGGSLRKLSMANGLHPGVLRIALARHYPKAQAVIAAFLEEPPQQIWPSRYEADGSHKRGLRGKHYQHTQSSKVGRPVNGNFRKAA